MTRIMSVAVMAGLIVLLAGGPSWAAKGKNRGEGKQAYGCGENRLQKRLGLSDEQSDKLKELKKARKEAIEPLRKDLQKEMKALREQVREEAGDKDIQATLDRLEKVRKDIRKAAEKFHGEMAEALSPSQRAKMMLAMAKRKAGFGRRGQGRGMNRGGGRHGQGRGWGGQHRGGFGQGGPWMQEEE